MIRIVTLLNLLIVTASNYGQPSAWKKFQVVNAETFEVESLLEVVDQTALGESPDTVRADLVVNDNAFNSIRFAKASCKKGEVLVTMYETNEANDHEYAISIYKGKYRVRYNYIASGENEEDGIIIPYETKLVLNTSDIKVGTELKGYTEFKGKCGTCKEDIMVKGNFVVMVR